MKRHPSNIRCKCSSFPAKVYLMVTVVKVLTMLRASYVLLLG